MSWSIKVEAVDLSVRHIIVRIIHMTSIDLFFLKIIMSHENSQFPVKLVIALLMYGHRTPSWQPSKFGSCLVDIDYIDLCEIAIVDHLTCLESIILV